MKPQTFAILTTLLLLGCRTKSETVAAFTSERHADSVAVLSSLTAREVAREQVWERVVMRPDTLGKLHVVERDIVRHTDNATETTQGGDTAFFSSEAREDTIQSTKTQQTAQNAARRGFVGFTFGIWAAFAALVVMLALFLYAKWKSRL